MPIDPVHDQNPAPTSRPATSTSTRPRHWPSSGSGMAWPTGSRITHRQQAFLDSVMHQLRTEGVLSDLTKISALLTVARHYVMADYGWNLLGPLAAEARNVTSGNLVFHTLPDRGLCHYRPAGRQRG